MSIDETDYHSISSRGGLSTKASLRGSVEGVWCRQWLDLFDCVNEDHEHEYAAMRREKCLINSEEFTRLAQREANL